MDQGLQYQWGQGKGQNRYQTISQSGWKPVPRATDTDVPSMCSERDLCIPDTLKKAMFFSWWWEECLDRQLLMMVPDPGHPPKAACGLRALKNDTLLGYGWTSLHSPSCHGANQGWWVSDCEAHFHTSIKLITGVHSAAGKHRKELNPSLPEMLRGWFRY